MLSGLVEVAYFVFLAAAYRRGDLSLVAPVARGTAPLILVVVGLVPDLEPALYLTVVVFVLLGAASFLLSLVYSQGRPHLASDLAGLPAAGGSSA